LLVSGIDEGRLRHHVSSVIHLLAAHPIVHVNAALNATATLLLVLGLVLIKQRREIAHKRVMMSSFAVSAVFLVCYLWYHYNVGHVRFTYPGLPKYLYYAVLFTHIPLAFTVPFLAVAQIYLGYRALGCCNGAGDAAAQMAAAQNRRGLAHFAESAKQNVPVPLSADGFAISAKYREKHRRLARVTFPIWLYVSVTGVLVYVMLYHLWPPLG
jgi:uncharacterized membrane protein YozB (DUF420 family)